MTLRENIVTKVVAQLRRIKTTNTYTLYNQTHNYQTNLGNNVFLWRAVPLQLGELPALIVRDLDEPLHLTNPRSQRVDRQLHMQVEIAVAADAPVNLIWTLLADVEAAIGEGRESVWDGITSDTRPTISRSVVEQNSAKIAGAIYEFYIDYPSLAFMSVS